MLVWAAPAASSSKKPAPLYYDDPQELNDRCALARCVAGAYRNIGTRQNVVGVQVVGIVDHAVVTDNCRVRSEYIVEREIVQFLGIE